MMQVFADDQADGLKPKTKYVTLKIERMQSYETSPPGHSIVRNLGCSILFATTSSAIGGLA